MHNLKHINKKSQQLVSGDWDFKLIWEGIKSASTFIENINEVWFVLQYLYCHANNKYWLSEQKPRKHNCTHS